MRIIVGLGNPGKKYEKTRHNAGFMAVDTLAKELGLVWKKNKKFNAETAIYRNRELPHTRAEEGEILLVKPHTYMNNSGRAVQTILSFCKLLPKKSGFLKSKTSHKLDEILTVIHDDIDIILGKYKIAIDSGSAGHQGVESIVNHLKTKNFRRFRLGIKTEEAKHILTDKFVLGKFNNKEINIINKVIEEVAEKIIKEIKIE
jgi:PTH1 family peptidyl-tRNA hydrolase